jgi:uncharacterized membrane protein
MDIVFISFGLGIFSNVLQRAKASKALTNVILLVFVLTPVVPLLAAQINYDNMVIPFTGVVLLLSLTLQEQLKNNKVSPRLVLGLTTLCLFTSIVKYAFLPLFVGLVFYFGWEFIRKSQADKVAIWQLARVKFKALNRWIKVGLVALLVLATGLFLERYAVNTIEYHAPIPQCNQVLTVQQCTNYSPWDRNYVYAQTKPTNIDYNPFLYTAGWIHDLYHGLFFTINTDFTVGHPLPIPIITAIVIGIVGILLLLVYGRELFRENRALGLFLTVICVYMLALWLQNYSDFRHTGVAVAVQGRYLLPILLLVYLLVGLSFKRLFDGRPKIPFTKPLLTVIVFLLFLQGGGFITYLIRSDPTWYWQDDDQVITTNQKVQKVLQKLVIINKNT